MSDLNAIHFPVANNPSFDAVQVMPLDSTNIHVVNLSSLVSAQTVVLSDTCEMVLIWVGIFSENPLDFAEVTRDPLAATWWALWPGYHYFSVAGGSRELTFFCSSDFAEIRVMEA